jgi:hypothetical protein
VGDVTLAPMPGAKKNYTNLHPSVPALDGLIYVMGEFAATELRPSFRSSGKFCGAVHARVASISIGRVMHEVHVYSKFNPNCVFSSSCGLTGLANSARYVLSTGK